MHEYGLMQDVVNVALASCGREPDRRVARVQVEVGEFAVASQESLETAFEILTRGTSLEGSALEISRVPGRAACEACGFEGSASDLGDQVSEPPVLLLCPACGSPLLIKTGAAKVNLVGHSQGGMLTKMTAIDSGTRFWDSSFTVPLAQLDISPEAREVLQRSLFFEPLPFVSRVVFIATPHRGSYRAGDYIANLLRKVISLPFAILSPIKEVVDRSPDAVDRSEPVCEDAVFLPLVEDPDLSTITGFRSVTRRTTFRKPHPSRISSTYMMIDLVFESCSANLR